MSRVFPSRLQTQIFSFVRQARASGLEADWINLITGKNVPQPRLEKLDQLIVQVLQTADPKEVAIDRSQPWAENRPDRFTNRNVLKYEIPRATRENLRDQALKENKDEAAAKQSYRQKVTALRNQLIRQHATGQTAPVVPSLRVDLDEEHARDQIVDARIKQLRANYPKFDELLSDPELEALVSSQPPPRKQDPASPQELLEVLKSSKTLSGIQSQIHEVFVQYTEEVVASQREHQALLSDIEKKDRSPYDPDWDVLISNPVIGSDATEAQNRFLAIRKLYSPVSIEVDSTSASVPTVHILLATLKKMEKISKLQTLPVLDKIEALAKRVEQLQEDKQFYANLKLTDDFSKVFPEGQEEFAKHLINHNWTWDKANSKPLL